MKRSEYREYRAHGCCRMPEPPVLGALVLYWMVVAVVIEDTLSATGELKMVWTQLVVVACVTTAVCICHDIRIFMSFKTLFFSGFLITLITEIPNSIMLCLYMSLKVT